MRKKTTEEILAYNNDKPVLIDEISREPLYVFKNRNLQSYAVFSKDMQSYLTQLKKMDKTRHIPVLITGRTGTGKEVIAKYIHYEVDGDGGPYIAINCSNVNKEMFEAELFGYNGGAFTGAKKEGRDGYIKLAANGTLFLDEITEIEPDVQVKLLRVLQEREYYKLGGDKHEQVKCRIIGASNRDVKDLVKKGEFREDLFYRLNVIDVNLKELKDRRDEIIPLLCWFIQNLNVQLDKKVNSIEAKVLKLLYQYSWPGNIRELNNLITQVMIFIENDTIKFEHLKIKDELDRLQAEAMIASGIKQLNTEIIIDKLLENPINLENLTLKIVKATLKKFNGNKSKTAKYLGLNREQLYNRFKVD